MKKIVLLGYMGSGKSTVGKALSSILSIPLIDLDKKIEEMEGMSISKLFASKGEIYFRRKERETLFSLLHSDASFIIATGGGTPCYGNTMAELVANPNVVSIYLKVSLSELVTRLLPEKSKRPLIAHLETEEDLHDFIRKHVFERSFYYNQAHFTIDANETTENISEAIVRTLF